MSNKVVKVSIEVAVMHIDSVPSLLNEVAQIMERESDCGMLEKTDGDKIIWTTNV